MNKSLKMPKGVIRSR